MTTTVNQATKLECELDPLYMLRYVYKQQFGSKLLVGRHHHVVSQTLKRVISGEITRLIVNLPPGYTKTEQIVRKFIPYGLALNPRARFLHLSYSDELALLNSADARNILRLPSYRDKWPLQTREDADSKSTWLTTEGGGVRASSTRGQVTGFRAGHMESGFQGAMLIDDPHKPDDVYHKTMREAVVNNYNATLRSRVALETTPVILVMQRLHYHDLSGFLLRGGSGEQWHHLCLPVHIDNSQGYPEEYTHGLPIAHGLEDGWLWPAKHSDAHATALQADRRVYAAQYRQAPIKHDTEGALWTEAMLDAARQAGRSLPSIKRTVIGVDPQGAAPGDQKKKNAKTGIVVCNAHADDRYSVVADLSQNAHPADWATAVIKAAKQYQADAVIAETNQGGAMVEHTLRLMGYTGRVIKVHATKGKYTRAEPVAALYHQGQVAHVGALSALEGRMLEYVPGAEESPDELDAMVWAMHALAPLGASRYGVFT